MNFYDIVKEDRILYKGLDFFIVRDNHPVSPGHLLIISNEIRKDYFELSKQEKESLTSYIDKAKQIIEKEHRPDGYNIGMNCGRTSGQTIFHFHCHLIPRYKNDMTRPKGGVRHCVEGKGYY